MSYYIIHKGSGLVEGQGGGGGDGFGEYDAAVGLYGLKLPACNN